MKPRALETAKNAFISILKDKALSEQEKHALLQKILQDKKTDINQKNEAGDTAITLAAGNGESSIMALLIEHQADPSVKNAMGMSALASVVRQGNENGLQSLIEAKVDVQQSNQHGCMPLHTAAQFGYTALAKRLIDAKANVDGRDRYGQTPLMRAFEPSYDNVLFMKKMNTAEALILAGADVTLTDSRGKSADLGLYFTEQQLSSFKENNPSLAMAGDKVEALPCAYSLKGRL